MARIGTAKANEIMSAILAERYVSLAELQGSSHEPRLVRIRREFCTRCHEAGLLPIVISIALNRNRTTVLYHLRLSMRMVKKEKAARNWKQKMVHQRFTSTPA